MNVLHPTYLSKTIVNSLEKRPMKSCIINISSVMDVHPFAGAALYSASKAYVTSFSSALKVELLHDSSMHSPVDVCVYAPSYVSTKINGMPLIWGLIPSPLTAAATALHDVGRFAVTNGRFLDRITYALLSFLHKYFSSPLDSNGYKGSLKK